MFLVFLSHSVIHLHTLNSICSDLTESVEAATKPESCEGSVLGSVFTINSVFGSYKNANRYMTAMTM